MEYGDYRYEPLEFHDSFRVIVLHKHQNGPPDPLRCTLDHVRLSDKSLKYDAISYAWGTDTRTRFIQLSETAGLHIRLNCYNSLLRRQSDNADRRLWIDAVCINQKDKPEKAKQVRLMNAIFSLASRVVVNLGEPTVNCNVLFEELEKEEAFLPRGVESNRQLPLDDLAVSMMILFEDPWFERVWVLSEVMYKEKVIFVCGENTFTWPCFGRIYKKCNERMMAFWPLIFRWMYGEKAGYTIPFSTPQFALWNRLYDTRTFQATKPRDRVYALKPLIGKDQSSMNDLINYDQTDEECLVNVAEFLFDDLGLQLLAAVRHPHDKQMPSWVSDWSQNSPLTFDYFFADPHGDEDQFSMMAQSGIFDRCEYAISRTFYREHSTIFPELHVKCYFYAHLVHMSREFKFADAADARAQMRRLFYNSANRWRWSDSEGMQKDRNLVSDLGQRIFEALSALLRDKNSSTSRQYFSSERYSAFREFLLRKRHDDGASELEDITAFMASLQNCRLSLMSNDELCIVPGTAQEGDLVCLLSGALAAHMLRGPPTQEYWTLVSGDCWVMTDEMLEPPEDVVGEVLTIR